jgi:hypothetical protein
MGKTGVHLRYHRREEYTKLTPTEKDELREWRASTGQGKGTGKPPAKKKARFESSEKAITSAVNKLVEEKMKAIETEKTNGNEAEAYIMSLFKKFAGGKAVISDVNAAATAPVPQTLRSIVKRAKNASNVHP